jgi:hypothetical protein
MQLGDFNTRQQDSYDSTALEDETIMNIRFTALKSMTRYTTVFFLWFYSPYFSLVLLCIEVS